MSVKVFECVFIHKIGGNRKNYSDALLIRKLGGIGKSIPNALFIHKLGGNREKYSDALFIRTFGGNT